MTNPYLIEGPALISFSGGRTSAFMLHEIIRAHGGTLPDDVVVAFANTGKEREETLRFVHECETRWGIRVHWLERAEDGRMAEVGYNSASRHGEPFAALVAKKGYLPNAVARFCTVELKIRVMRDLARSLGWDHWHNIIGLRYDEGARVLKSLARSDSGKEPWRNLMPLSKARVTVRDVLTFWLGATMAMEAGEQPQGFDLELRHYEGNCDACFLKGRGKLKVLFREHPTMADWWIQQERSRTSRFVTEYRYADLAREVRDQPSLFVEPDPDDEHDAECGLWCEPDQGAG